MIEIVIVMMPMFAMTNDTSYNNNGYKKVVVLGIFVISLAAISFSCNEHVNTDIDCNAHLYNTTLQWQYLQLILLQCQWF